MGPHPPEKTPTRAIAGRLLQGALIGLLAAAISLIVERNGWLERWEARTWDWRASLLCKPGKATGEIQLVFLDQNSLDWGARRGWSWPWPREVYGAVTDFCRRAGARAVVFDVIYSEPSVYGVEDDEAFAAALATTPGSTIAVFAGQTSGDATRWPSEAPEPAIELSVASNAVAAIFSVPRATFPTPPIVSRARMLATVFGNPDSDGIYRRLRPLVLFDGRPLPSLGMGAWAAANSAPRIRIEARRIFAASQKAVPLDRNGFAILRFRGPSQTHATVSIASVIESELRLREGGDSLVPLDQFRNKYVFVGFTAPGLFDLKSSPVAAVYPGVEIHATFLDNLLSGDFIRETPLLWRAVFVLALAILAGMALRAAASAAWTVAWFLLFLSLPPLAGLWYYAAGLWLPVVPALAAALPAMLCALVVNYATEGRQKRFIKGAFRQYLSPVVIEELVRNPERLRLGGEQRTLSIYFSDVQGFTGLSEALDPETLTALLNDYLTAMTEIIYAEGGTVDKYEGDAVIAFWNAPLAQEDHAIRAVRAALACQRRLAELRPVFRERVGRDLYARIGINTGPVVVGNMGSRQRFNYTFLGDAGNLASRLEGINKIFGTSILISEFTRRQTGEAIPTREIGLIRVVGRKEPVRVFEPLSPEQAADREKLDRYAQGLAAYYAGRFDEALRWFENGAASDPPSAAFAARCRELLAHPPAAWDGVWSMTEK